MSYKPTFILLLLALILCTTTVTAQVAVKWEEELPATILWQQITDLGQLVVCTQAGLSGINTETGEVNWQIDELANLTKGRKNNK